MTENLPDTNVGNIEYIRKADVLNLPQNIERNLKGEVVERSINVEAIKALPSADVIPVVRCKDCGWAMKSTELPGWYMCKCEEAFDYYAKPDDFCSHGERRE